MYISFKHKQEEFKGENYKTFSIQEFKDYVGKISVDCGLTTIPQINFYDMDRPGFCAINNLDGEYVIDEFGFKKSILYGQEFSIYQVEEIIRHEIAHAIATLRYNDDCDHDLRWIGVAEELGCEPSPFLCMSKYQVSFETKIIQDSNRGCYFYLECSNCNKIHLETNKLMTAFQLFAFSGTDVPLDIRFGDLSVRTSCCNTAYTFIGKASSMLRQLEREKQLEGVQEFLRELLQ